MAEEAIEEGPDHCPHCGKEVIGEFDFCPYCGKGLRVMKTPQISYHPHSEKKCLRCSATIDVSFEYCPYCGHHQGLPLKKEEPILGRKMILLYTLSFFIPPVGVVIWMIWKKDPEGGTRNEGEYCLGAAFLGIVVYIFFLSIYALE